MADKNNIADENYLDNLLKAITGEGGDTSEKISDDELDFDSAIRADGSEEAFLSDFEKEFFDESESQMLGNMFDDETSKNSDVSSSQTNIPDDMLFDIDNDILGEFEDTSSDTGEMSKEAVTKDLVNEAIDAGDTSIEEDLQGLYGILGVDSTEEGLPENIEETPKKKALFGRKDKEKKEKKPKEKKEKKEKKSKKVETKEVPAQDETEQSSDGTLDGLDIESLFDNVGNDSIGEDNSFDMSDGFGLSLDDSGSMDMSTDEASGDYDFGLDDSAFGDIHESENDMLIRQAEEGELDDDELLAKDEEKGKKKGKKEKKKKEKKEKEKKEKAPKKQKSKPAKEKKVKEPKVKKPTDPDDILHIPIVAIIFMLSFVIVAVVAVKMGGEYYYYQEKIYDAVELYVDTDQTDIDKYESRYSEAYRLLSGLEMRTKEHQAFYDQVETIMFMDRHYEAYKNYMLLENFDNGLDSLIKAIKMYDKYQNEARELGCFDDMTVVLSWVNDKLNSTYGITESRARELSMITDDQEYAVAVRTIAGEAEEKYLEKKAEEELK